MKEDLKRLLRQVYSVDTEAGHRFQYHITRAFACSDYALSVGFLTEDDGVVNTLRNVFVWMLTPENEGFEYWNNINVLLNSRSRSEVNQDNEEHF